MAPWWHACMPVLHVYPCLKPQLFIPRGSAEYCISSLKYQPINWFNISYSRLWPGRINQWKPHLILTSPNTKQQSLFVSARALWCTIHTCVSAEVYVSQYHKETTEKVWVYPACAGGGVISGWEKQAVLQMGKWTPQPFVSACKCCWPSGDAVLESASNENSNHAVWRKLTSIRTWKQSSISSRPSSLLLFLTEQLSDILGCYSTSQQQSLTPDLRCSIWLMIKGRRLSRKNSASGLRL